MYICTFVCLCSYVCRRLACSFHVFGAQLVCLNIVAIVNAFEDAPWSVAGVRGRRRSFITLIGNCCV